MWQYSFISIHAPSRERQPLLPPLPPLPTISIHAPSRERHADTSDATSASAISIHAPSRERLIPSVSPYVIRLFQSTLPHGSDWGTGQKKKGGGISIHAPSRERRPAVAMSKLILSFQSTLPHGSDIMQPKQTATIIDFNPRSLTGATQRTNNGEAHTDISIHAPSRERQHQNKILLHSFKSSIYCELAQFKSLKILF